MGQIKRICVWSGPRNISTALMYSFAQRSDTTVLDEPLYAHYLSKTPAEAYHPASAEVIAAQDNDGERVVRDVVLGDYPTPVVFQKMMAHHLVELDWSFMAQTLNVLLIRNPIDMLPSYAKNVEQPSMVDVGYAKLTRLYDYLLSLGQTPLILDSQQVLLNPRRVLTQLCEQVGIAFEDAMLSWEAGARPEDGVWAPYWYHNVHQSTGFGQYRPKTAPFPAHLKPLLAECQPHYDRLRERAILAE